MIRVTMKGGVLHLSHVKSLPFGKINKLLPIYKTVQEQYIFSDANYIDYEWIESQIQYINTLDDRKKHIIRAYTIYGDRFVNQYLRNTLTQRMINALLHSARRNKEDPFLYQHQDYLQQNNNSGIYSNNIKLYITQFINELETIIRESPPITKPIKVFRGVKPYVQLDTLHEGDIINYNNFTSTSIYLPSALQFIENNCCMFEIILQPGTQCLFTAYISRRRGEYEITLNIGTQLQLQKKSNKIVLDIDELKRNTNVITNIINQSNGLNAPIRVYDFISIN